MNAAPRIAINDLTRAIRREREELERAIGGVLDSGWVVMGPQLEAFEHELADYLGISHVIGVASGTDALVLALQAVGCGPGDRVVTVANAGGYTTNAVHQLGAVPVYVDVEPDRLTMSVTALQAALATTPRAVVVTHLYGQVADLHPISAACAATGVPLVEDCAQSIGARTAGATGRMTGSIGDAAAFSFYPTKNLGALGDAGAVAVADGTRAEHLKHLRQYGWEAKYRVGVQGGRNSRLDELQAAVLRARLGSLDVANKRRRAILAEYASASRSVRFVGAGDESNVAHLAVAVTDDRDGIRSYLTQRGIGTDIHYPIPDHQQPSPGAFDVAGRLAETERAAARILTVPCYPDLTDDEVATVATALSEL